MIAVSTDDPQTLKKFKESLQAPYSFVSDPEGKLLALFDSKMPLFTKASRNTFVIGPGRKVVSVQRGSDAIDPSGAIQACALPRKVSPEKGGADAGDR